MRPFMRWRLLLVPCKILAACCACLLLLMLGGWLLRPDVYAPLPTVDQEDLAKVTALRDISFPATLPRLQVDVDYAQGATAPWWPTTEPPVLAGLVAASLLPPVAERVGPEPLVLAGIDGPGQHGGTWHRIASTPGDVGVMGWRLSAATPLRWSPLGHPVVPHLLRGWSLSEDRCTYTMYMRRGMRWSDGEPLTTRDVAFWWEEQTIGFDGAAKAPPQFMQVGGGAGRVEIIDEHTYRFVFPQPHPLFLEHLAKQYTWCMPAHYLRPFHPRTGDQARIAAEVARRGEASAEILYGRMQGYDNVHHPRLWPWIYRTEVADGPFVWVRNPYFCAVDTQGRQLPYLDQIQHAVKQSRFVPIAAAQGEVSFQRRGLRYQDYPLLMKNRHAHDYEVYHWYPGSRSDFTIFPNVNRRVDPGDVQVAHKARLLAERDFRHALSLAIDRPTIIEAVYFGQIEAAQIDPGPDSPYHSPQLYRAATAYDPAQAERLLDGLGLSQLDPEGYRTAPDGTRLTFFLNTCTEFTGEGPALFLIEDWKKVGLRVVLRDRNRALWNFEKQAFQQDLGVWTGESEFLPLMEPRNFLPTSIESFYAPAYGLWYASNGLSGVAEDLRRAAERGGQAPPEGHPLLASMRDFNRIRAASDAEEQRRLWQDIAGRAAEHLWTISVGTHPPQVVVVKNGLKGVPRNALDGAGFATPGNAGMETWWWDPASAAGRQAALSPDAAQRLADAMLTVTDRAGVQGVAGAAPAAGSSSGGFAIGALLVTLFWGSLALGLILLAVRHAFVLRRLLILVPTLLLISVIGYVVIQLPPGDALQTQMAELRLRNDEEAIKQFERLEKIFHTEDSQISRYSRWLGLSWFTTFADTDRGLLQGFLGYSMQDGKPVNDKVGDRIALTMAIAVLAIVMTWAIALITGVYSAVRQYSSGDYLLTFISFIGMSVPGFLLALVCIFVANTAFGVSITGLFSPEYAAEPGWSWAKLLDLLQHIWVPVVVAAVGGTAGLFRVMRGNLLDELKKPYVTTARAKGVRPLPLLVKYPVRVALNPVVSTIGGLFPELISGSAIIAVVLSLPTVGPLMLEALLTEDMYFAGSMLMMLSLLGVFGTLVSDLLLLWLDPRIRMGAKA